jgi:hypothetical protein
MSQLVFGVRMNAQRSGCPINLTVETLGIGTVHRMLTRPTYAGLPRFNKRGKSKELKPDDQVIAVEVPPIID